MPTIDLSIPAPPVSSLLHALPRRVALTLPELRLVARQAGDAPLPFDVTDGTGQGAALEGRLGSGRSASEDTAYAAALDALHDPAVTLERRGLLGPDADNEGLLGAVGLLATPTTALDIDVTVAGIHARSWHRQAGEAVATLSTVDGISFELTWFEAAQWPAELGRAGVLPEDVRIRPSGVPAHVEIPFALADAAAEAMHNGRSDLVPVLAAQHAGAVIGTDGPLPAPQIAGVLTALSREAQGRLRVLVADVASGETSVVGVVAWTLLADGWHALRPRSSDGVHRVVVSAVEPSDLAAELAPVLAEVST